MALGYFILCYPLSRYSRYLETNSMPLITINQVQKYYGDNHVLKGVDLDIDMGQVISIIGAQRIGQKARSCAASTAWKAIRTAASSWAA